MRTLALVPWSPGSPFTSGIYQLSPHGVIATEYEEFGCQTRFTETLGAVIALTLIAVVVSRFAGASRSVIRASRMLVLTSFAATLWVVWRTHSLASPTEYVELLPVVAQLLPVPQTLPDTAFQDKLPVSDFVIDRYCRNDVCVITPRRGGVTGCSLSPIIASNGPLALRGDVEQGLWVFDGVAQTGTLGAPKAQLPFRHSDLRCVWPGAANLPRAVRMPRSYVLASLLVHSLALILAFGATPARVCSWPAIAVVAAAWPWVGLVPWLLSLLA